MYDIQDHDANVVLDSDEFPYADTSLTSFLTLTHLCHLLLRARVAPFLTKAASEEGVEHVSLAARIETLKAWLATQE